jgi:DNA-directed RNA polymerase specialized sigma24 family protein
MKTFEESIDLVNIEIAKRKNKWRVYCAPEIDFDDISQILRIHIFNKWAQWDQSRPLANWLNRIISNQMANLIRDNYSGVAPPCSKCSLNQGGNLCGFTLSGEQCSECPLYAKWEKSKKSAYNIKLASSLDNDEQELSKRVQDAPYIDWPRVQDRLTTIMRKKLPAKMFVIYEMLYIKNFSDEELAVALDLKTREKNKTPGYKQIYNLKQKILVIVKEALKEEDLFV